MGMVSNASISASGVKAAIIGHHYHLAEEQTEEVYVSHPGIGGNCYWPFRHMSTVALDDRF